MTEYFAPDTNFFLQCKKADQILWLDVTDADSVVLMVVKEVQREIDKLKNQGNTRRASRAREVSAWFKKIGGVNAGEHVLRDGGPHVVLRLIPRLDPQRVRPAELDLSMSDERIVEEALAAANASGQPLTLLTHDGAPLQAAREVGLAAKDIPDSWLLDPEPSPEARDIADLKRQVARLTTIAPSISVTSEMDGNVVNRIEGGLTLYQPASREFISRAMATILRANPRDSSQARLIGFAPYDRNGYIAEYDKWEQGIRDRFDRLNNYFTMVGEQIEVTFVLDNSGGASADDIVVDIQALGDTRLGDPNPRQLLLSKPPSSLFKRPPQPKLIDPFNGSHLDFGGSKNWDYGAMGVRSIRRTREFFWSFDEPSHESKCLRGECDEFRHNLYTERRSILVLPSTESDMAEGALHVRISAKNLASTLETTLPVRIHCHHGNTEHEFEKLVLRDLGVVLE